MILTVVCVCPLTWLRYGFEEGCTKEDPLSQENFRKLALPLPFSKQHHSKLVCYISKELMDTEDPPQVLPNGYVYSTKVWFCSYTTSAFCSCSLIWNLLFLDRSVTSVYPKQFKILKVGLLFLFISWIMNLQALKEMAEKNGGIITCPRTGFVCNYTELVKAYISWTQMLIILTLVALLMDECEISIKTKETENSNFLHCLVLWICTYR